MKIQTKLTIGSSLLTSLALIVTSFAISFSAGQQSSKTLEDIAIRNLVSNRELTGQAIAAHFSQMKGVIQAYSADKRVIEFAENAKVAYQDYKIHNTSLPDISEQKSAVSEYYRNQYAKKFQQINGKSIDTQRLIEQLSPNSLALQYQYIAINEHPLGAKDLLENAPNDYSLYNLLHSEFQGSARDLKQQHGLYNIAIADIETGHIMYSTVKELDYATSLIDGPFANSAIGEAFRKAVAATEPDDVYLTDYAEYLPSYNEPVSFMASPIFSGEFKVGVVIFQMPIDKVNGVTTHNGNWQISGLGKTGETILVGKDGKLRSSSRQLIENKKQFIEQLRNQQLVDENSLQLINQSGSNVLLQTLSNPAIKAASRGEQGETRYVKYTGDEVLSAYKLLKIMNQEWVLLSELNVAEANIPTQTLLKKMNITAVVTALLSIIVCIFIALFTSRLLMKPIAETIELIEDLAGGEGDLRKRINNNRKDETGILASGINLFIEKIQTMVRQINSEAKNLHGMTQTMETIAASNAKGAEQQQTSAQQVSQSMIEMNMAVNESAQSASTAEQAAASALASTHQGAEVVTSTSNSIEAVASNVEDAVAIIQELESTSDTIGSVVGVINGIAEQTNLLALNAAIEAARAGEQGRGFAVVADEVRALASRTQESTLEINSIIEKLQQTANSAVTVMNDGHTAVGICVKEAEKAQHALEEISQQISDINTMNLRIATSAEEQSAVSETVQTNIEDISEISNSNAEGASIAINKAREMSGSINMLRESIAKFSID